MITFFSVTQCVAMRTAGLHRFATASNINFITKCLRVPNLKGFLSETKIIFAVKRKNTTQKQQRSLNLLFRIRIQ